MQSAATKRLSQVQLQAPDNLPPDALNFVFYAANCVTKKSQNPSSFFLQPHSGFMISKVNLVIVQICCFLQLFHLTWGSHMFVRWSLLAWNVKVLVGFYPVILCLPVELII